MRSICISTVFKYNISKISNKSDTEKTTDVTLTTKVTDENNRVLDCNQSFLPDRKSGIYYGVAGGFDTYEHGFRNTDKTLIVEFELEVRGEFRAIKKEKKWDFGVADRNLTDVVLVAEEQKFHVNKTILATHSSYFHTLFFGPNSIEFAPETEIKLENILAETLQSLLEILYHTPNVHIDNAEDVLEAGRMYSIPLVSDHCKQVIVEDGGRVPRDEKRRLAEEFGIDWGEIGEEER